MNRIVRSSFKLPSSSLFNIFTKKIHNQYGTSRLFSSLTNIGFRPSVNLVPKSFIALNNNIKSFSSESNDVAVQLKEFLEQEIPSEEELLRSKTIPSKIDDFDVKLDGSDVTLVKKTPLETITITFNVNDSVQGGEEDYNEHIQEANEPPELKSKPNFDIDITKGDQTLGFMCEYVPGNIEAGSEVGGETEDIFVIQEVTLYTGEFTDKVYRVSGSILDGYLYDVLMNLLDSKGISNEFVSQMSELSTAYEQSSYISFLRGLKHFATK